MELINTAPLLLALSLIDDNTSNATPWASMVECGLKSIETRTWPLPRTQQNKLPNLLLLLCASQSSRTENAGKAVCVVNMKACQPFEKKHVHGARCTAYGGYAWVFDELYWLTEKWAVKGRQGLYEIERPAGIELYVPTQQQRYQKQQLLTSRYGTL